MLRKSHFLKVQSDAVVMEWYNKLSKLNQILVMDMFEQSNKFKGGQGDFAARGESIRYSKQGLCGAGGMGSVFVMFDRYLSIKRAVKISHSQFNDESDGDYLQRSLFFEKEIRLLSKFDHPGIPQIIEVGFDPDGNSSYIMNLIKGDPLDVYIQRRSKESIVERLTLFFKVCDIINYAHETGVAHLDIKPDNIIVSNFGQVYVIDWGLSLEIDSHLEGLVIEGVALGKSTAMGTPEWIAPEQLSGMPASRSMDVFTLSLLCLYILTGKLPRCVEENDAAIQSLAAKPKTSQTMRLLGELPVGLRKVLIMGLEIRPAKRIKSVAGLQKELQHWMDFGITTRERKGVFGFMKVQRVEHPLRYFTIVYAFLFLVIVIIIGVGNTLVEKNHLSTELNEIMLVTDFKDSESRKESVMKLRILQEHHEGSTKIEPLIDYLESLNE